MTAAPFTPPKYTEAHYYIFDKKTGEILATETRWTDEGAEDAQEINTGLVRRVAEDGGRAELDVDVLQAPKGAYHGHLRVDVATRKLISVRRDRDKDVALPAQLGRP